MGALWNLLALDSEILNSSIINVFNKTKEIEDANVACANAGKEMLESDESILTRFKISEKPKEKISISGNEAMALGAYAAGVRAYFAYPMTPSSPVLQTISHFASKTGIIVKQAEDEITAVNMVIGANHAGTRAMCGTSGGGFDLMTEALSLSGITETPLVVILAHRPGPATGAPTWTAQGDLNLAIFAGHGQFLRIVLAPGDNQESFEMIAEAHNLAEKFQTPVIIMNDKYLGETLYTTDPFSSESITIDRGEILENPTPESMRYQFTESGISPRWFPGTPGNTFVGNSDEHDEKGHSVEDADKVEAMISKRIKKESTAHSIIPEPEYFGSENAETVFIGWGSTKHIMLDAMKENPDKIGFLYFKYISPLRKEKLIELKDKGKKFVAIENNEKGHFADYIQMQTGIMIPERILKFDGRPFFIEEVVEKISNI
jgi:2-oxoglutarate ferredoxin oxidoreductase subunit alpha